MENIPQVEFMPFPSPSTPVHQLKPPKLSMKFLYELILTLHRENSVLVERIDQLEQYLDSLQRIHTQTAAATESPLLLEREMVDKTETEEAVTSQFFLPPRRIRHESPKKKTSFWTWGFRF
jgi:hypothetical protein